MTRLRKSDLRNIGIIAHVDAGKTTLTERLLYFTGKIHATGEVHHGASTTDSSVQEKQKGITINSAAVTVSWKNHDINIIDTPGHIDFNVEVNRALRVLDGAVVVFDAVAGVEPQTETNWRLADDYDVPRICLVNKMDRTGADFDRVVQQIEDRLCVTPLVMQLPIGTEAGFSGVLDLCEMQAYYWHATTDGEPDIKAIPEDLLSLANDARQRLIEAVAEYDDDILLAMLEERTISANQLQSAVRACTLALQAVPVCCASAYRNTGVQPVLDAIVAYLPSPADRQTFFVEDLDGHQQIRQCDSGFSGLVFKVVNDRFGAHYYLRVYSGVIRTGDKVLNSASGKLERIGRIVAIHADQVADIDMASAGDIVALLGLKHSASGDTLCCVENPVVLERIPVPEPVVDIAVEPVSSAQMDKMMDALIAMRKEDPSFHLSSDASGQVILSGMGELHLEVKIDRLKTDFGIKANIGKPQVAYRETITDSASLRHVHKKQDGGPGQYAVLALELHPVEGESITFESTIVGAAIPSEYIPSIEKGIRQAADNGILAGYPCGGFHVVLTDGDTHAQDSSQMAFELAAKHAFEKLALQASPRLLEPVMIVEVVTPQDHVGDCIGDLMRRRGIMVAQDIQQEQSHAVLTAYVPLSEMFGYISDLRALTAGRANYQMHLDHYSVVPDAIADSVIAHQ